MDELLVLVQNGEFNTQTFFSRHKEFKTVIEKISNNLPKEVCAKFLYDKIVPVVFDTNLREDARERALNAGLQLLELVNITNMEPTEQENVLDLIQNCYIPFVRAAREKDTKTWDQLWIFLLKLCHVKVHTRVALANNLLQVVELAFRNSDSTEQRMKAYDCWLSLIDNSSLNTAHMSSAKQIKLLITPMKAKFTRTPPVIPKKFDTFVYLLEKLQEKAMVCLKEFLEFCYEPFGEVDMEKLRQGQGKSVPEICARSTKLLMEIIGHSHMDDKCIESDYTLFKKPIVNDENFPSFVEVLIKSVVESCILLRDWNKDSTTIDTITKCLWRSLLRLIKGSTTEYKEKAYKTINNSLRTVLNIQDGDENSKFFQTLLCNITEVLISEQTIADNLGDVIFDISMYILQHGQSSSDVDVFLNFVLSRFESQDRRRYGKTAANFLEKTAKNTNSKHICEIWLKSPVLPTQNYLHLIWAIRHLNYFSDTNCLFSKWKKLYVVDCKADANKIQFLQECENMFLENPLVSGNLIAFLTIVAEGANSTKDFITKLMRLISTILTYPSLSEESVKKLGAIIITFFDSNQLIYQQLESCDESIIKLFACLEHIIIIHKNYSVLDDLSTALKKCSQNLLLKFSNHIKLFLLNVTLNDEVNISNKASELLEIFKSKRNSTDKDKTPVLTPSRSLRIMNMANSNTPKSLGKQTSPTSRPLKLFGQDIESSPSPVVKGSQLLNPPTRRGQIIMQNTRKIGGSDKKRNRSKNISSVAVEDKSSDYVKFDTFVNVEPMKLTQHQKEVMKKRREDIPALYQDLSQSQSQDFVSSEDIVGVEVISQHLKPLDVGSKIRGNCDTAQEGTEGHFSRKSSDEIVSSSDESVNVTRRSKQVSRRNVTDRSSRTKVSDRSSKKIEISRASLERQGSKNKVLESSSSDVVAPSEEITVEKGTKDVLPLQQGFRTPSKSVARRASVKSSTKRESSEARPTKIVVQNDVQVTMEDDKQITSVEHGDEKSVKKLPSKQIGKRRISINSSTKRAAEADLVLEGSKEEEVDKCRKKMEGDDERIVSSEITPVGHGDEKGVKEESSKQIAKERISTRDAAEAGLVLKNSKEEEIDNSSKKMEQHVEAIAVVEIVNTKPLSEAVHKVTGKRGRPRKMVVVQSSDNIPIVERFTNVSEKTEEVLEPASSALDGSATEVNERQDQVEKSVDRAKKGDKPSKRKRTSTTESSNQTQEPEPKKSAKKMLQPSILSMLQREINLRDTPITNESDKIEEFTSTEDKNVSSDGNDNEIVVSTSGSDSIVEKPSDDYVFVFAAPNSQPEKFRVSPKLKRNRFTLTRSDYVTKRRKRRSKKAEMVPHVTADSSPVELHKAKLDVPKVDQLNSVKKALTFANKSQSEDIIESTQAGNIDQNDGKRLTRRTTISADLADSVFPFVPSKGKRRTSSLSSAESLADITVSGLEGPNLAENAELSSVPQSFSAAENKGTTDYSSTPEMFGSDDTSPNFKKNTLPDTWADVVKTQMTNNSPQGRNRSDKLTGETSGTPVKHTSTNSPTPKIHDVKENSFEGVIETLKKPGMIVAKQLDFKNGRIDHGYSVINADLPLTPPKIPTDKSPIRTSSSATSPSVISATMETREIMPVIQLHDIISGQNSLDSKTDSCAKSNSPMNKSSLSDTLSTSPVKGLGDITNEKIPVIDIFNRRVTRNSPDKSPVKDLYSAFDKLPDLNLNSADSTRITRDSSVVLMRLPNPLSPEKSPAKNLNNIDETLADSEVISLTNRRVACNSPTEIVTLPDTIRSPVKDFSNFDDMSFDFANRRSTRNSSISKSTDASVISPTIEPKQKSKRRLILEKSTKIKELNKTLNTPEKSYINITSNPGVTINEKLPDSDVGADDNRRMTRASPVKTLILPDTFSMSPIKDLSSPNEKSDADSLTNRRITRSCSPFKAFIVPDTLSMSPAKSPVKDLDKSSESTIDRSANYRRSTRNSPVAESIDTSNVISQTIESKQKSKHKMRKQPLEKPSPVKDLSDIPNTPRRRATRTSSIDKVTVSPKTIPDTLTCLTPNQPPKDNLPGSPINVDTPDRTIELFDCTLDISPITSNSGSSSSDDVAVFPTRHTKNADMARGSRLVQMVNRNLRVEKSLDGEGGGRSSPAVVGKSPGTVRRIKLMPRKEENLDYLTFSREIPSPMVAPASGILKRKFIETESEASMATPSPKRKRVNFCDPAITQKKLFVKDTAEYEHSAEPHTSFIPETPDQVSKQFEEFLGAENTGALKKEQIVGLIKTLSGPEVVDVFFDYFSGLDATEKDEILHKSVLPVFFADLSRDNMAEVLNGIKSSLSEEKCDEIIPEIINSFGREKFKAVLKQDVQLDAFKAIQESFLNAIPKEQAEEYLLCMQNLIKTRLDS